MHRWQAVAMRQLDDEVIGDRGIPPVALRVMGAKL